MTRASTTCGVPGCWMLMPCAKHQRKPWSSSDRAARLPVNWPKLRAQVRKRDAGRCQNCGGPAVPGQVDHKRRGDDHSLDNLQLLCDPCHDKKTLGEAQGARRARG